MKPALLSALLCACLLLSSGLSAQEGDSFSGLGVPPAPVVSALSASVSGTVVTLTWQPAPGITGSSLILRAEFPITAANESSAELRGTVDHSVTAFTDTLEGNGKYWYAVVSSDDSGSPYNFFLPASNSLILPVTAETSAYRETVLSGFSVRSRNDAVIISWNAALAGSNLVIYRSTLPFTSFSSLVPAVLVSAFTDTGGTFTDYPVPGVPYYYAVLDENSVHSGSVTFVPGGNTNGTAVEIPQELALIRRSSTQSLRPMPLPYLNPTQTARPEGVVFSSVTEERISQLAVSASGGTEARRPYVFRSDSESTSSGGDEYALRLIVNSSFRSGNYEETIERLNDFLSLRRSVQTSSRAHFYKGESLYFLGKAEDALLEFLLARDSYENQAGEWIQYSLSSLATAPRP